MSGISPTSGSTSNLSSVGQSILTNGSAPNAVTRAGTSKTDTTSPYQKEFQNLQQYDTQELLYASFLSPDEALANADSVFAQAAKLLGAPGRQSAAQTAANQNTAPASNSTSTASSSLGNVPSVASILAASDAAAQKTLQAYANAPAGSSILDFQA